MADLVKSARSAVRGVLTFGPSYMVALASGSSASGFKSVKARWGRFYFRPSNSDIAVYRQVFERGEYDLSWIPQYSRIIDRYEELVSSDLKPIILDAGANNGVSAIWFATKFPKAVVLAVEPDPDNAALCRVNTADFPNITVVEAAIGSESGQVDLHSHQEAWAVQTKRSSDGRTRIVTVPELMKSAGGDARGFICKIDIEGFESDLFASNTDWIDQQTVIILEPHEWISSCQGSSFSFQRALMGWGQLLISGENLVFVKQAADLN